MIWYDVEWNKVLRHIEWNKVLRHRKIAYREGVRDGVMVGVVLTVVFGYIWLVLLREMT